MLWYIEWTNVVGLVVIQFMICVVCVRPDVMWTAAYLMCMTTHSITNIHTYMIGMVTMIQLR